MKNLNKSKSGLTRRKFLGGTAAAAALSMVPVNFYGKPGIVKSLTPEPDSKFGGVQIGAITYSWRDLPGGIENIIKYCTEAGISSVELMSGDVETFLGAPKNPMMGMFRPPAGARPPAQAGANPPAQAAGNPPAQGAGRLLHHKEHPVASSVQN